MTSAPAVTPTPPGQASRLAGSGLILRGAGPVLDTSLQWPGTAILVVGATTVLWGWAARWRARRE